MNFTKASRFILFTLMLLEGLSPRASAAFWGRGPKEYDVVFLAEPLSVRPLEAGSRAEAVENLPEDENLQALAVFRIKRVILGEFKKEKEGGPTRFEQAADALKNKEFFKVLGLDFQNPDALKDKELIRIAVKDPGVTFGMTDQGESAAPLYRIYLKRVAKNREAFLFIKCVPLYPGMKK